MMMVFDCRVISQNLLSGTLPSSFGSLDQMIKMCVLGRDECVLVCVSMCVSMYVRA